MAAHCPCHVGAGIYANQSHKTGLSMLFPPLFKNRYHFLSAAGDAQPFYPRMPVSGVNMHVFLTISG